MSMAVSLNPAHVPAAVRTPLEAVITANTTTTSIRNRLDVAAMDARPQLQEEFDQAAEAGKAALAELVTATIENAPAMRAAAGNAFAAAIERARGHIAAAQTELRDAADAAALFAQIKDGRPTLNASSERAARSNARGACMRAAGELRNLEMPEDVDD
jgi:hypothetical protein